jgi:phytoene dehydrogenase-like protein
MTAPATPATLAATKPSMTAKWMAPASHEARAAVYAAKHAEAWGEWSALMYAVRRGVSKEMWQAAKEFEARRQHQEY